MSMFDFFGMAGNYEARKVDSYNDDKTGLFISTARVTDGKQPFETAVGHPDYRDDGKLVIVEAYDTKAEAQRGHDKWLRLMTTEPLPDKLVDCCNAGLADFASALGSDFTYPRKTK